MSRVIESRRLCSEEETGQPFETEMIRSGLVQISVRGLGIRNIGSEVAGQHEIPPGQGIGEVCVIVAARQVAT